MARRGPARPGGARCGSQIEQRPRIRGQFLRVEQANDPVFAVIAGVTDHLLPPQPSDRLDQSGRTDLADRVERDLAEDRELRAEPSGERCDLRGHRLALRPDPEDLADDLGQGDQ